MSLTVSFFKRFRKRLFISGIGAMLAFGLPAPLSQQAARAQMMGGLGSSMKKVSYKELLSLMKQEGYNVSLDSNGDIRWKIDGYKTSVYLYDDEESLQFYVAFDVDEGSVSLKSLNRWNRKHRFSTSYLDEEGSPCLQLDLSLDGGISRARLINFLKTCRQSFTAWLADVIRD